MNPQDDKSDEARGYADEVLCANWHPLVVMLVEARAGARTSLAIDVEGFLARLYSSQQP